MNAEAIQNLVRRRPFQPFDVVMVNGERFRITDPESLFIVSTDTRDRRVFAPYASLITVEKGHIVTRLLDVPLIAQIVDQPTNGKRKRAKS